MPVDILIYAIVAAVMVFWLRNVIGTRHGEEKQRPNPFEKREIEKPVADVVEMKPVKNVTAAKSKKSISSGNTNAEAGLVQIALADKNFDTAQFVENASDAFTYIVTAFAEGDTDTLKDLCNDDVYRAFESAITDRVEKGETVTTEIHSVRKADIVDAGVDKNKMAYVTIRFTADETYVIRDSSGAIIAGHPDRVTEMTDKWTFSRNVRSTDPRWLLSKTEDDVVDADGKTPMPDAG
jgi:predicted lipid-binding transport protein (Tim44 family)